MSSPTPDEPQVLGSLVQRLDGDPFPDPEVLGAATKVEADRRAAAVKIITEWRNLVSGAEIRAGSFKREALPSLAFAAAGYALAKVLTGEVPINTVKEASDIAKVAVSIGRLETGDPDQNTGQWSPERLEQARENVKALHARLDQEAQAAQAAAEGAEVAAADIAGSVPPSPAVADDAGIVRDTTPQGEP